MNNFKLFKNLYSNNPEIIENTTTDLNILPHYAQYNLAKPVDANKKDGDRYYASITIDGEERDYIIENDIFKDVTGENTVSFNSKMNIHMYCYIMDTMEMFRNKY